MLTRLKHPNIILLMGVVRPFGLVTEWVPVTLRQLLHASKRELSFQDKVLF